MPDWALPGTRRITLETHDLAGVTQIDTATEVDPARAGLSRRRIDAVWYAVEDFYRCRVHPAMTFCLRCRGHILLNRAIGYRQGCLPEQRLARDARPAEPDTPICLFSASKAVIAVLIHKLAEEGGVDLDAPVSRYVPAFSGRGKRATTIAQVLSHRGGFPSFAADRDEVEILTDWDACITRICQAPAEPGGRQVAYHAMTGGFILGEVIRAVTGAPVTDYLDAKIRQPLGMRYFTYGLDGRSRSRVATNHVAGMPVRWPISRLAREALSVPFDDVVAISNRDVFMDAVIPSGNLYATTEELSRFYQMLLGDGVYDGRQVLAPETIQRLKKPVGRVWPDRMLKLPMHYSEGLMLGTTPVGLYGPLAVAAYGHLGFMNILGWADPDRDLAVSLLSTGKAVLGGHLVALLRLLTTLNWQFGTWRRLI